MSGARCATSPSPARPTSSIVRTTRGSPMPHASQSSLSATAHETGGRSSSSAGWSSVASSIERRMRALRPVGTDTVYMQPELRRRRDAVRRFVLRVRAVYQRYNALNGRATAAAITLYGFLALFALAVLAVAVVGFLSSGNDNVAEDIVNWLGVTGTAAKVVTDAVEAAQPERPGRERDRHRRPRSGSAAASRWPSPTPTTKRGGSRRG